MKLGEECTFHMKLRVWVRHEAREASLFIIYRDHEYIYIDIEELLI